MQTKPIIIELNYLGECSQRELEAYRKLGSISDLKRLKQQEIRRKHILKNILQALRNFTLGAVFAVGAWMFISFIDIAIHNIEPNPVYQIWNFFTLLF